MITKSAFTLIELSIVLVIIGLIVGGVLVGQDLIAGAKMRSLVSQVEKYNTAVTTFRLKYNCLAGDCAQATQFFPADATCNAYGGTSLSFRGYMAAPNGQTCNGDGSLAIHGPSTAFGEIYLFWQHLSLAGLIEGDYTGAPAKPGFSYTGSSYFAKSINAPAAPINESMITILNANKQLPGWTGLKNGHYFWLGAPYNGYWGFWPQPVFTPTQAKLLDDKIDDGAPRSGALQSDQRNITCYTGSPATYRTNLTDKRCSMIFKATF